MAKILRAARVRREPVRMMDDADVPTDYGAEDLYADAPILIDPSFRLSGRGDVTWLRSAEG